MILLNGFWFGTENESREGIDGYKKDFPDDFDEKTIKNNLFRERNITKIHERT